MRNVHYWCGHVERACYTISVTARLIRKAQELLDLGVPAIEAIEVACDVTATTPAARELARKVWVGMLARAERNG